MQAQPSNTRTITKCLVDDVTTYSDDTCIGGKAVARVTVNPSQNLADGLPVAQRAMLLAEPAPAQVVAQGAAPPLAVPANANKQSECVYLEKRIKFVDMRARQPQAPSEQDRLAAERKKYRDEQFRLTC